MEAEEQRPAEDNNFEIVGEEEEAPAAAVEGNARAANSAVANGAANAAASGNNSAGNAAAAAAPAAAAAAAPKTAAARTAAQQQQIDERQAMFRQMEEEYKKTFGDDPKAPKPKFLMAGRLIKIKRNKGQNAYETALGQLIAQDQNIYYGYSKPVNGANGANRSNNATASAEAEEAEVEPLPVEAAAAAPVATGSPALFRSSQTRRRIIKSLEEVLDALRAEEGRPPSARSPVHRVTSKRSPGRPRTKAKTLRAAAAPIAGQQAIARARASLTRKAGVKISQKIAAPFAKWAKGKPREEVSAKKAEVAAALQARAGRNNNAIAVNTGLKTRENVERRRREAEQMKAKKAAAAAGQ